MYLCIYLFTYFWFYKCKKLFILYFIIIVIIFDLSSQDFLPENFAKIPGSAEARKYNPNHFMKTVGQGAATTLYAALSPDAQGGKYGGGGEKERKRKKERERKKKKERGVLLLHPVMTGSENLTRRLCIGLKE
jgi:hypothetical protein